MKHSAPYILVVTAYIALNFGAMLVTLVSGNLIMFLLGTTLALVLALLIVSDLDRRGMYTPIWERRVREAREESARKTEETFALIYPDPEERAQAMLSYRNSLQQLLSSTDGEQL